MGLKARDGGRLDWMVSAFGAVAVCIMVGRFWSRELGRGICGWRGGVDDIRWVGSAFCVLGEGGKCLSRGDDGYDGDSVFAVCLRSLLVEGVRDIGVSSNLDSFSISLGLSSPTKP